MASELLEGLSEEDFLRRLHSRRWRHRFMAGAIAKALAIQIHEMRKQRGWTLRELSHASKLSVQTVWRMERAWGVRNCTLRTLLKLAAAFDCALVVAFDDWGNFARWVIGFTREGCRIKRFDLDSL